ncbi:hypothetical protein [Amycolatopsis sp. A1MSW2902]|uniref:hypothetical protein n=1 Tax=Amycolatopsis sp. A1MSW2902 TaxID=687413 RepID=UPI00307E67F1
MSGGTAGAESLGRQAEAGPARVLSYFEYGRYSTVDECVAYGQGYVNAHPGSSGFSCIADGPSNSWILYVDDGITD